MSAATAISVAPSPASERSVEEFGVSVVIPCLNESETLALCIEEALRALREAGLPGEVVIADNGSTDGSQEIARKNGARVVPVRQRGYGAALHGGILGARYSIVVFGDADMSYPFVELKNLVEPIVKGEAEFVLGSRLRGTIESNAMPTLNRHVGTPVLSFLIRTLHRLPTSDCNSGMRAVLKSCYRKLDLRCPGMEYASEMLIRVAQAGLKYAEVPIGFRKDRRSRPPHLKRWRDGWRHLRFILGNAGSPAVIITPGVLGLVALLGAFLLSFPVFAGPDGGIRFHSAFGLIALSMPLFLLSLTFLLVKAANHESTDFKSRLVARLHSLSENAAPFYVSMGFYALALVQLGFMFLKWRSVHYAGLFEIGMVIRATALSIVATLMFSMDLGLGLLKLVAVRPPDTRPE